MKKNDKIYVAGGQSGLVGTAIVRALKKKGFTNIITKTRKELNLLEKGQVEKFFKEEKPDYVFLAAARVGGIKDNMTHQADFLYENLQIQNNIMWTAHKFETKKLLFLGSSCIYPRNCLQPMKEEYFMSGGVEPTNEGYAIAKIAGLKLCEKIYSQYGKCFVSCMPTNIYGPKDNFNDESAHVIPSLIRRIYRAKINNDTTVTIWGGGTSRREFLFVDDLADAVIWMMNNYTRNDFLNIGTGEDISIKQLATFIKKLVGYKGALVFDKTKPDGMPRKLLDVSKIRNLGWQHNTSLEDGLSITYKWYIENIV